MSRVPFTELISQAASKHGYLLSTEYINAHSKLLWKCHKGHLWEAVWNNIKSGQWCPKCAGRSYTREELLSFCIDYAGVKGGTCLSTSYISNNAKLLWECEEGHQWEARWSSIKYNKWCPTCARQSKPALLDLCAFAMTKNGKCNSLVYVNAKKDLDWECICGHKWKASWDGIKRGNWCPTCASFKTELRCKKLLEVKFGFELTKTRVYYDKIHKHKYYEWDGYNKEHKIAFEYHGYQHYVYPNYWHKTEEEHLKAIQRDLDKIQYAKENGIKLILIPYTEYANLETYVANII